MQTKTEANVPMYRRICITYSVFILLCYKKNYIHFSPQLQCRKRKLKVSVVAVPKTIDNDILLMDKTFGFDTAVEEAQRAINSAYIEVS